MNAKELRADIAHAELVWEDGPHRILYPDDPIFIVARTIALPILEADPELVERIAIFLRNTDKSNAKAWKAWPESVTENLKEWYRNEARRLLAAISTPTPGAE